MHTDLMYHAAERLADDVRSGRITEDDRATMWHGLRTHIETVAAMQRLTDCAPIGALIAAQLVCTAGAPALTLTTDDEGLPLWAAILEDRGFVEVGISDAGHEYRGAFLVRLVLRPALLAEAA